MTPQELVATLRQQYGAISARELAACLGVAIHHAVWPLAKGRMIQFAECTRHPRQITLNNAVIERLSVGKVFNLPGDRLATARAGWRPALQNWFTCEQIGEVFLAHELYHLLTPPPSVWAQHTATENAAHAFAQCWTGLPFHPSKYEEMLWAIISA